jgi:CheY-like chemotaxis protein
MISHASEAARLGLREADIGVDLRTRRKCLSARAGAAPIVFITAHADESVHPRLLERGAVACPVKPFSDVAFARRSWN